jgi:hypothetical protein
LRIGGTNEALFGFIGSARRLSGAHGLCCPEVLYPVCPARACRMPRGTKLRSGEDSRKKPPAAKSANGKNDRDMGSALRSVYQRAVDEEVPQDLLDLLGKLD